MGSMTPSLSISVPSVLRTPRRTTRDAVTCPQPWSDTADNWGPGCSPRQTVTQDETASCLWKARAAVTMAMRHEDSKGALPGTHTPWRGRSDNGYGYLSLSPGRHEETEQKQGVSIHTWQPARKRVLLAEVPNAVLPSHPAALQPSPGFQTLF